jgi:protein-L-isoaspartate(D-aspartate) O-methyltransferase
MCVPISKAMPDPALIALIMQLRREGITDTRVLSAMEAIPRDAFVDEAQLSHAFDNRALPIACNQTISQPSVVALMTQALGVSDRHMVLEIGTGSGYQAAILSKLARRVHTVERHAPLHEQACARFEALKLHNITAHPGDGTKGWPHAAPYDRIMVTAAAAEIPHALLQQLRPDGVMVLPLGRDGGGQMLTRIHREGESFVKQTLGQVKFVPLVS